MAIIDPEALAAQMAAAAIGVLKGEWPKVRAYAEPQFKELARIAADIEAKKLAGKITEEQARHMMKIQRNALDSVIITLKDEGLLAAEKAINAALEVAAGIVNAAIGWQLLG